MATMENVQELLTEQLGKHRCDVIATTAMTGKSYYAIHFPVESVISHIAAANAVVGGGSDIANLETTIPAGNTIFLNISEVTLTSGIGLAYYDQPL